MHVFIDQDELSAFLSGVGGAGGPRAARVSIVPGGVEVRAAFGEGALALRVTLAAEPGRGLHLEVTVLDPAPADAGAY